MKTKQPLAIIISFGIYDSKKTIWNEIDFYRDYKSFILSLLDVKLFNPSPKIYLIIPPPLISKKYDNHIQPDIVNKIIPTIINKFIGDPLLKKYNIITVDLSIEMSGPLNECYYYDLNAKKDKVIKDGFVLNELGDIVIAHAVAKALLGENMAHEIREKLRHSNKHFNDLLKRLHNYEKNILLIN